MDLFHLLTAREKLNSDLEEISRNLVQESKPYVLSAIRLVSMVNANKYLSGKNILEAVTRLYDERLANCRIIYTAIEELVDSNRLTENKKREGHTYENEYSLVLQDNESFDHVPVLKIHKVDSKIPF